MRRAILVCKTVEAELRKLLPSEIEIRALEQGLHRTPERLRESLQLEIDSMEADEILLGYGLCGNGVVGLKSSKARLVVPRVDDCIALLLGSCERYQEEFEREPGTYWLSWGWIEHATDPYKEYLRVREKYDEDTACWVAREMLKGYRRLALIDTGAYPLAELQDYARKFAGFFELEYCEMVGTDELLSALVASEPRNGQFVVVEPGQEITAEMFLPPLSTING